MQREPTLGQSESALFSSVEQVVQVFITNVHKPNKLFPIYLCWGLTDEILIDLEEVLWRIDAIKRAFSDIRPSMQVKLSQSEERQTIDDVLCYRL